MSIDKEFQRVEQYRSGAFSIPMSFDDALMNVRNGARIHRGGWNGKGMYLVTVRGVKARLLRGPTGGEVEIEYPPHIAMRTADGTFVPWLASVTDIMANDWYVLNPKEPW